MSTEPEIGTREWWRETPTSGARGILDTILRLLEQEEITRSKARELVQYALQARNFDDPPTAPWDRLNWCDDGDPLTLVDIEAERQDPGHLARVNADLRSTFGRIAEWCRIHGADLCPGAKADTYGNGMRDAKLAVSRLLSRGGGR